MHRRNSSQHTISPAGHEVHQVVQLALSLDAPTVAQDQTLNGRSLHDRNDSREYSVVQEKLTLQVWPVLREVQDAPGIPVVLQW